MKRYHQLVETGRLRADSHQKGTSSVLARNTFMPTSVGFVEVISGQRANNSGRESFAEVVFGSVGL